MDDIDSIPLGGPVPFSPNFRIAEPVKPSVGKFTPDTKSRVNRNFNKTHFERIVDAGKLNGVQVSAAEDFLKYYRRAHPTQCHDYSPRQKGNRGDMLAGGIDAETVLQKAGQAMGAQRYGVLVNLLVHDYSLDRIADAHGRVHGWKGRHIPKRIAEILTELASIWRDAVRQAQYVGDGY